jgi:hypothetical protein
MEVKINMNDNTKKIIKEESKKNETIKITSQIDLKKQCETLKTENKSLGVFDTVNYII